MTPFQTNLLYLFVAGLVAGGQGYGIRRFFPGIG